MSLGFGNLRLFLGLSNKFRLSELVEPKLSIIREMIIKLFVGARTVPGGPGQGNKTSIET